jgi:Uma2 family endonuclease
MPTVPNAGALTLAPDWVCEITSPSSIRHDRIDKMRAYARESIAWVWLVDPLARTLECFRLDGDRWTVVTSHAADEVVRIEPFAEAEIRLGRWWLAE